MRKWTEEVEVRTEIIGQLDSLVKCKCGCQRDLWAEQPMGSRPARWNTNLVFLLREYGKRGTFIGSPYWPIMLIRVKSVECL